MMVRIGAIHAGITVLGPGRRIGLWVAGCSIGCSGCASTHWWPRESGIAWPASHLVQTIMNLAPAHDGITLSGGEPFQQAEDLACVIERACALSSLNVLIYSGYTLEQIVRGPAAWARLLAMADVLIAGPYVADAPTDRPWVGSANQVVHALSAVGQGLASQFHDADNAARVQIVIEGAAVNVIGIPRQDLSSTLRRSIADQNATSAVARKTTP